MVAARWEGAPRCPDCGCVESTQQRVDRSVWMRWRCAGCHKRFTVTTDTRIHSTKLTPSDWLTVAELVNPSAKGIIARIHVSGVTARKISDLMRDSQQRDVSGRLRYLMQDRPERRTVTDPWQIDPLPSTLEPEDSPIRFLSGGAKSILNAMRARPFGATAGKLAELSEISYAQALRCLADLERRGWADKENTAIQNGHKLRPVTMWNLSWSEECMRALMFLRDRPVRRPSHNDGVPPRFWRNFWSGASAETLRISQHGLHIAETLIGGRDPCARSWALCALPIGVLQQCRDLRGCDTGFRAELIDNEIERRGAAS